MISLLFAVATVLAPAEIPDLLAPPLETAGNGKGCPKHIERCSADQVACAP